MQNTRYYWHILMKFEFSQQIFEKSLNIQLHENPSFQSRIVPCRQTDERINMTKLIAAFLNFAKAPKMIPLIQFVSPLYNVPEFMNRI
jgi:hypothetical protein